MKFNAFIGPLEEFEKFIPKDGTNSLTRVVTTMDSALRGNDLDLDVFDTLVVYSNEYSGVKEHFIEGFINYILLYSSSLDFEEVFLHNPPKKILEQLENHNSDTTLDINYHQYKSMTKEKLRKVKEEFDLNVFGQEHVKNEILQTIYPLTNLRNNRPKVMMLYGPPGVGKTETAKLINRVLDKGTLFRKQLSMFHNDNIYSYIFGDKVYSLAKDLIDRRTNIILLDEFDKAHPLFYSAFFEMFDEGKFEDKYYKVNLDNTIIFCTSNYQSEKDIKDKLGAALFSRFDNVIQYKELSEKAKLKILEQTYTEELKNFNEDDRIYLKENGIFEKMSKVINHFENARDIQKNLVKVMSYPLVEKL
ncbi:AAA family ATPase [Halobacillus amylolyticus]|uniref:AAA family ATPase n=1 Tax=Halobacillus amylolyticus TaxID=2932259 RepID=A0ABY4HD95_9BACI|nr:AAA family ATPase [Halobacillus amylolyticus]UOR12632.1 AAA family ATPase [Halobacillus amylolyticus]